VGVGTCWPWETAAMLPSAGRRKAHRRPRGEERGGQASSQVEIFDIFGDAFPPREPIGVKFRVTKRTHVPLRRAKFHMN